MPHSSLPLALHKAERILVETQRRKARLRAPGSFLWPISLILAWVSGFRTAPQG